MDFSANNRNEFLKMLQTEKFDVIIIGGGITGAGCGMYLWRRIKKK